MASYAGIRFGVLADCLGGGRFGAGSVAVRYDFQRGSSKPQHGFKPLLQAGQLRTITDSHRKLLLSSLKGNGYVPQKLVKPPRPALRRRQIALVAWHHPGRGVGLVSALGRH